MREIAYFISPHGLGHAARACALMDHLHRLQPGIHFSIFTTAPEWFFQHSLRGPFTLHRQSIDIGIIQKTPLEEDLEETISKLAKLIPFSSSLVLALAAQVSALGCQAVICDIAPLGIAVAKAAGIPSILVENFTWDWIYQGYLLQEPRFHAYIQYLGEVFTQADVHIQTQPICRYSDSASLVTLPVGRSPRLQANEIHSHLGIPGGAQMILATLDGIPPDLNIEHSLPVCQDLFFVISGIKSELTLVDNRLYLPPHSGFYYPDLVNASRIIISKAGYSTVAEAYLAGVSFAYLSRPDFRETSILAAFIHKEMGGFELSGSILEERNLLPRLRALLESSCPRRVGENGAQQAARFILSEVLTDTW